jgi:MFS family permease
VLSGYTITALLVRPFSGYVVDTFPRKTVLMIAFGAFAIFFAGYLAASTLLLFTIVRTLHGGPFGAVTTANATVAIDVLPSSRRTEGIGYYGLSNNLAMATAPTIGIWLYQLTDSFDFLFWLALIVACAGWLIDSTVKLKPKASAAPSAGPSHLSLDRFFLTRGWLLGVNMIAFGFSFGVLSNYLAIYGKEVMGITGGTGTYFLLCSIGLILSRLQGSKALRAGRVTHNAAEGRVISLVGYTLFILMPTLTQLLSLNSKILIPNFIDDGNKEAEGNKSTWRQHEEQDVVGLRHQCQSENGAIAQQFTTDTQEGESECKTKSNTDTIKQ